jgi:hypothetical protein
MRFTPLSHSQSQLLLSGTSQFHASYSELIGQLTPCYTIPVISVSDMLAQQPQPAPAHEVVIGTSTTEMIPSLVALTDPLQIPVTQTEPLVTPTLTATVLESQGPSTGLAPTTEAATEIAEQTQTTSPIGSPFEGSNRLHSSATVESNH